MEEQKAYTPEQKEQYNKIRAIHWTKRSDKQKAEYEELKKVIPQDSKLDMLNEMKKNKKLQAQQPQEVIVKEIPYVKPKVEGEETVTMTKKGLLKMLEEIRQEERDGKSIIKDTEWQEYKLPPKRKYTAKMKVWQKDTNSPKGLIVDWKRLRFDIDPATKDETEIFELTIRFDGGEKKTIEVPIIQFSKFNEEETVEIVKIKDRKMQKKEGETNVSVTQTDDTGIVTTYTDSKTNKKVPLLVFENKPIATIKRANDETFDLPVDRLNH